MEEMFGENKVPLTSSSLRSSISSTQSIADGFVMCISSRRRFHVSFLLMLALSPSVMLRTHLLTACVFVSDSSNTCCFALPYALSTHLLLLKHNGTWARVPFTIVVVVKQIVA